MRTPPTLSSLPPEILINIAAFLSAKDMVRMAQTCRSLRILSDPETIASALSRHRTYGDIASLLGGFDCNLDLIIALLEKFGPDGIGSTDGNECSNLQFAIDVAAQHGRTDLLGTWFERYKHHGRFFEGAVLRAADAGNIDLFGFSRAKFYISVRTMSESIRRAARANQLPFIRHVQRDIGYNPNSSDLCDAIQAASHAKNFDLAIALIDDLERMSYDTASSALQSALMVFLCCAIKNERIENIANTIDRVALTPDNQAYLYELAFSGRTLDAARIIDRSINQSVDTRRILMAAALIGSKHGITYVLATRSISPEFVDDALVIAARHDKRSVVEMLYPLVTDYVALLEAVLYFRDADLYVPIARAFWSHNCLSADEVTDVILEYYCEMNDLYEIWFGAVLWLASMDEATFEHFKRRCAAKSRQESMEVLPELLERTKDSEDAASHQRLSALFASLLQ